MVSEDKNWMPTDNAGKIFASLDSWKTQSTFRISASLYEPVEYERLLAAFEGVLPRFPHFQCYLRAGFFWPYFEWTNARPSIYADSRMPVARMSARKRRRFPFRLRVYHTTISLEVAHVLTDGSGAMAFLVTLLGEYLGYKGPYDKATGLLDPREKPEVGEMDNAFDRYYNPSLPPFKRLSKAFWLPMEHDVRDIRHITIGSLHAPSVIRLAKEKNATVGEFITANYLHALQAYYCQMPPARQRSARGPIRLDMPMNLRGVLPESTLRNFFLPLFPEIDPRLGTYSFDEILELVSLQLRQQKDIRKLMQLLARNVSASRNLFLRFIPLVLKDLAMPEIYHRWNLTSTTSSLSNLGLIRLPEELENKIARFDMIPTHPSGRGITCAMISYQKTLRITFNRLFVDSAIEQLFFRHLASLGLEVEIESNQYPETN